MPLPPALLARLKKRGIVNQQTKLAAEDNEEVLVEDYSAEKDDSDAEEEDNSSSSSDDDTTDNADKSSLNNTHLKSAVPIKSALKSSSSLKSKKSVGAVTRAISPPRGPVEGCPNTSNQYHECSLYCKQRYGLKTGEELTTGKQVRKSVGFSEDTKEPSDSSFPRPEDEVEDKMPLPPFWIKVIDPKSGYSYYWNRESDLVTWLHPLDEDAVITLAASKLAEAVAAKKLAETNKQITLQIKSTTASNATEANKDESEDEDGDEDEEPRCSHCDRILNNEGLCPSCNKPKQIKKMKGLRPPKRPKVDANEELDPMDPAAYDESVPRGTWSTGLIQQGAKAADSTAAGPLFQQRPYPSPGDVLRANREQPNSD